MAKYAYNVPIPFGPTTRIRGFDMVMANLNKEILAINERTIQGLIKAAIAVRRETENGAIRTPRDLGNLVHSWFVVTATRTPSGSRAQFTGPKASKMGTEHSAAIAETKLYTKGNKNKHILIMGYSANYALWVHERLGENIKWKRPHSGPKWFEAAFKRLYDTILLIIKKEVQIKP